MAWYDQDSWLTAAFAPNPWTIALTLFLTITLPILLHQFLYRKATPVDLPAFLLAGPSGGGKTAFATSSERKSTSLPQTHTSTTPLTISATLPEPFAPASASFRSPGDPSYERARRFLLLDTPGHGKLRHFATSQLANPTHIRGIIFVVDAAALSEDAGLSEAAGYLHDILLTLQKRYTNAKTSKGPKEIPVLVAGNKEDLFTALPANLVKMQLEKGITEVRASRAKALKDSGAALGDQDDGLDEEREWLGEGGEGAFEFRMMEEVGCSVHVVGGNVIGAEGADVKAWWQWIAEHL